MEMVRGEATSEATSYIKNAYRVIKSNLHKK
jgi:hypothetical protein